MGANQQRGANFWRRTAAEVDASFLDIGEYAPAPRRGPAASTISQREEAESNLRWARARLREKLRGPVGMTEALSLGLGAAAFAVYASHGIPRRAGQDTADFARATPDGKAAAPGDAAAAAEARATAAPAWGDPAVTADAVGGGGRRAARGTTFIPTTILRPAGEADGLGWSKAPAGPSPLTGRGPETASTGKAGPSPDTGLGMAANHAIAAQIIADADMAAVAAPYVTAQQAAAEPRQAKASDGPAATAKAPPGPGSDATHAAARPDPVTAEAKPAEPQAEAAAAQAKAVPSPAGAASPEAAGTAPLPTDHAAVPDTHGLAAGDQGKAAGTAAIGATLVVNQGIAAARATAPDDTAPRARAEPGHASDPAGPAKTAGSLAGEAPADHGNNVPATNPMNWSAAGGGRAQAATLDDIVLAVKFDLAPPGGVGATAPRDAVESLGTVVQSHAADHAISIPGLITLPEAVTKGLDAADPPKVGMNHAPAGAGHEAKGGIDLPTSVAGAVTLPDTATKVLDTLGLPKASPGPLPAGGAPAAQAGADHPGSVLGAVTLPDAATKVLDTLGLPKAGPGPLPAGEAPAAQVGADHPGSVLGAVTLPDAATKVLDTLGLPKAGPGPLPAGEAPAAQAGADHPGSVLGVVTLPDAATKVLDTLGLPKAGPDPLPAGEVPAAQAGADHPGSVLGAVTLPDAATKVLDALGLPKAGPGPLPAGEVPAAQAGADHPGSVLGAITLPDAATKVLDTLGLPKAGPGPLPAGEAPAAQVGADHPGSANASVLLPDAVAKVLDILDPTKATTEVTAAHIQAGDPAAGTQDDVAVLAKSPPDQPPAAHGNAPDHLVSTTAADQAHLPATDPATSVAAATPHPGTAPMASVPAATSGTDHAGSAPGQQPASDLADVTQALNVAMKTDPLGLVVTPDHATDPGALVLHTEAPPSDWAGGLVPALPVDTAVDGLFDASLHGAVADLSIF